MSGIGIARGQYYWILGDLLVIVLTLVVAVYVITVCVLVVARAGGSLAERWWV